MAPGDTPMSSPRTSTSSSTPLYECQAPARGIASRMTSPQRSARSGAVERREHSVTVLLTNCPSHRVICLWTRLEAVKQVVPPLISQLPSTIMRQAGAFTTDEQQSGPTVGLRT